MSFIELLIILLLIFIVPKIIRAYLIVRNMRRQARQIFEQMYGEPNPREAADRRQSRRPGWSTPGVRKKKIDPNVGEYVKFQEISVTETSEQKTPAGSSTSTTVVEQQVTDAEWEEI